MILPDCWLIVDPGLTDPLTAVTGLLCLTKGDSNRTGFNALSFEISSLLFPLESHILSILPLEFFSSSSQSSNILELESELVCASLSIEFTLSVLSPDLTAVIAFLPLVRKPKRLSALVEGRLGAGATVAVLWDTRLLRVAGLAPPDPRDPDLVLQGKI